jgi:hypothetical protein
VAAKKPIGTITRGTTNPNRLRRVDRYIAALPILRSAKSPVVVDLGFGASPITAVELLSRLSKVNPETHVVGVEIERERVDRGLLVAGEHLHFVHGGFETPIPSHLAAKATVIRAFNVLRQYSENEVAAAWDLMLQRITEDGVLVEGTCDEIGRLSTWVTLTKQGPQTLTISMRLGELDLPSKVAERLPKALIHRNVEGENIYRFLQSLDAAWRANVGLGAFSAAQRWVASCNQLVAEGWPLVGDKKRWRLGELTIDWAAVSPN